ncbi:hypothetical protein FSP39_023167 [Pinctada imbricata]|uniref:BHLH domain-containing protein n=1 Tax=Pinctada imbricata TaxID=66713 RepID=A0AA88XE20_PINIB|nr:hypothetical protein FSP39_023167 [Pinctada imbricata]
METSEKGNDKGTAQKARNARERKRVKTINEWLFVLKNMLPDEWMSKNMSKLEIIRKSRMYIQQLHKMLEMETSHENFATSTRTVSAVKTLSTIDETPGETVSPIEETPGEALSTVTVTEGGTVSTMGETRDKALSTVTVTEGGAVSAMGEIRDKALSTVTVTEGGAISAMGETREKALSTVTTTEGGATGESTEIEGSIPLSRKDIAGGSDDTNFSYETIAKLLDSVTSSDNINLCGILSPGSFDELLKEDKQYDNYSVQLPDTEFIHGVADEEFSFFDDAFLFG